MKYRIIDHDDMVIVVTQDGGFATIEANDDGCLSEYYQRRLEQDDPDFEEDEFWELMGEGNVYSQEWSNSKLTDATKIQAALAWLCVDIDFEEFVIDESIWRSIFV